VEANQEEVNNTDLESNREEKEVVAEHQEVPNKEAALEIIGAVEDQYGNWHLGVGCLQQPKTWTQGDGGSLKKLATARKQMARCAIHARHKGNCPQGPGRNNVAKVGS
jgi:hypothetical protein